MKSFVDSENANREIKRESCVRALAIALLRRFRAFVRSFPSNFLPSSATRTTLWNNCAARYSRGRLFPAHSHPPGEITFSQRGEAIFNDSSERLFGTRGRSGASSFIELTFIKDLSRVRRLWRLSLARSLRSILAQDRNENPTGRGEGQRGREEEEVDR